MNSLKLKSSLEQKFELVCFYDLATVLTHHKTIFNVFKQHHSLKYKPNQRLIFYSEYLPSQLILNHIQRAATKIDISNFFIVICTPHNITEQLVFANKKYGNDTFPINWISCSIKNTNLLKDDAIFSFDSVCALPFGMITVHADQTVYPCCKYPLALGSIRHSNLIDLFNSSQMQQLRDDIKQGVRHKQCKVCWNAEDQGNSSLRTHFINKYGNNCDQEWFDDYKIRDLTVSPTNLCNFKCRICSPNFSSSIAVEELKFSTDPIQIQQLKTKISTTEEKTASFYKQIYKIISDLNFLHILGGEPFKWHELDQLLNQIIINGNSENIQLEFNTNGSIFPKKLISKFLKFKLVEILVSIDDIGDRFVLQRGSDWNQILNNLLQFKNVKSTNIDVKIATSVNIQNVLYLDQLVNFCEFHDFEIVWNFVDSPDYLCIDFVTQTVKDIVHKKYADHSNLELQGISKRIMSTPPASGKTFIEYMTKLDHRRGQDSSIILKEIFNAMLA
jgi:radical SAM protein with 4Fe4S-binding SPASM domain